MRILHLVNHVDDCGIGTVNATVDLAMHQSRQGHEVIIASLPGSFVQLLGSEGVEHVVLEVSPNPAVLPRSYWKLSQLVKRTRPDIVHSHTVSGSLLGLLTKPRRGYRTVSTLHTAFQRISVVMGTSDRVIAVSEAVAEASIAAGIPRRKVRVVLTGALGSPRYDRQSAEVPQVRRPSIVSVGGLYRRKGQADLVSAFASVANHATSPHLYLLGDGPERRALLAQVARADISGQVHVVGFQTNVGEWLRRADIAVLASYREPFGLALLEARAAGCAVLGSTADGIPEVLEYGSAGLLFPPGDVATLSRQLQWLLDSPGDLARQKVAAQRGLERFSASRMASDTLAVYTEVLGSGRG